MATRAPHGMMVGHSIDPSGASQSRENIGQELIDVMQKRSGKHQGYRTDHAKGVLVEGTFTPTSQAKTLSTAAHFNNASTNVLARFSVGSGSPAIKDTSKLATPKGLAVRFQIDDDTRTDLIAHSYNGFATQNGEDYLTFVNLVLQQHKKGSAKHSQVELDHFLKSHSSAKDFLNADHLHPLNYGTITYYQPCTHVLTNSKGKITNVRYRIVPENGDQSHEDTEEIAKLAANYLEDDLLQRLPDKPIVFTIQAHIAGADDVLDDATKPYESTKFVSIGKLELKKVVVDNVSKQQEIAFLPDPSRGGIEGIKPSRDPLIDARKKAYWTSADQRRNEKQNESMGFPLP